MKLIILHGPPAVGKLTVAQELSKIIGYKVLHNHLVNDLAEAIFEYGSPEYIKLVKKLWTESITTAVKSNIKGIILTYCYAKKVDDAFMRMLLGVVEQNDGEVQSVLLKCDLDLLYERVEDSSRKKFGKIKDKKKLKKVLSDYDLFSPISFIDSLTIDNTKISAKGVAKEIRIKLGI